MAFLKGSEWRKWDLHVHTPLSIVQHYGGNSDEIWEKFIKDLEELPEEFSAIGINDYLFVDGYKKVLDFKEKGRLKKIELILPVLEFRLNKFAGTEEKLKRINFHVIFSNHVEVDTIQGQFINALSPKYHLTSGIDGIRWSGVITRESVSDLGKQIKRSVPPDRINQFGSDLQEGFNNLVLDEEDIIKVLRESSYFCDASGSPMFLTAVGKTEWESLKWNDASIASKKDIINKADFVFISSKNVEQCLNARNKLREQCVNDLLLDCSDAHSFSDSTEPKDKIGKCFTWIKADAVFDSLRYVIHDPQERVRIQLDNPCFEFPKPYFSKIEIQEGKIFPQSPQKKIQFSSTNLELNSGLVAIIGGRGSGKSILLDAIAKTFQRRNEYRYESEDKEISMQEGFTVGYTKNDGDVQEFKIGDKSELIYLHVHQREVQDKVKNPERLSEAILDMLGISLSFDKFIHDGESIVQAG